MPINSSKINTRRNHRILNKNGKNIKRVLKTLLSYNVDIWKLWMKQYIHSVNRRCCIYVTISMIILANYGFLWACWNLFVTSGSLSQTCKGNGTTRKRLVQNRQCFTGSMALSCWSHMALIETNLFLAWHRNRNIITR